MRLLILFSSIVLVLLSGISFCPAADANPYCVSGANWASNGVMVNLGMPSESYGYVWNNLQPTNVPEMVRPVRYWDLVGVDWTNRYWGYLQDSDDIVDPVLFGDYVDTHLGKIWIIGNEPNLAGQDGLTPAQYAAMYKTYYDFISSRDSAAQFAVAAVSGDAVPGNVNGSINYWNQVLAEWHSNNGPMLMPVDIWNFHCYATTENRNAQDVIDLYVQPFIDWVRTVESGAYASAEIWCTEFGVGFWHGPLNAEWVAPFMQRECLLFEQVGIDRWFWFLGPWDSWSGDWQQTCLLDASKNPTILGQVYNDLANNYPNTTATPMPDPPTMPPPKFFTDDFEAGGSDLWIDKAGDWEVADGTYGYRFGPSEPHWWGYYSQLPYNYEDFDLEVDAKVDYAIDNINWAGIYFRFPVMFGHRGQGGYLVFLRQNGELGLHNQVDGTVMSVPGAVADTSVFHRIRVTCSGDPAEIEVSVDGALEISWTDPNGRFAAGYVALEGGHAECSFDNLVIENLGPTGVSESWRFY